MAGGGTGVLLVQALQVFVPAQYTFSMQPVETAPAPPSLPTILTAPNFLAHSFHWLHPCCTLSFPHTFQTAMQAEAARGAEDPDL